MGCNPFGKMISMACGRMGAKGEDRLNRRKERRKRSHEYDGMREDGTMQATSTIMSHHGQPTMKSVVYSNDSPVVVVMHPQDTVLTPSTHAAPSATGHEGPRPTRVRFTLPEGHKEGKSTARHPEEPVVVAAPVGGGSMLRYMPSPSPAREHYGGTGECHHYPTPIREGIYRLATESNRLTTMFSEENPNACSIV